MTLEEKLLTMIQEKPSFNEVFSILKKMGLSDAFLCAGSLRDFVWSDIEDKPFDLILGNLDIYYYDPSETYEQYLTKKTELNQRYSKYLWELTNLALNNTYGLKGKSIPDVISSFPETCSAVGICQSPTGSYQICSPYGLNDLFSEKIKPTKTYLEKYSADDFKKRVERKKWLTNFEKTTLEI